MWKSKSDIKKWSKKVKLDPVLIIAWIMATVSAFFVYPNKEYIDYIDWRSLGILWSLMVVIQGLRQNSVFEKTGEFLLKRVKYGWQLASVLIFMCFFGSMLITNDVALITFVPFAIMVLRSSNREDLMIPVVVLQTVAANMGSMLTPIGNPQNLYIYGVTGMPIGEFILTMLPLTSLTFVLLVLCIFFIPKKGKRLVLDNYYTVVKSKASVWQIIIYCLLFILALCSVLRLVPWYIMASIILVVGLIINYRVLLRVDYILLLTFVGFFIFTGNIGRIEKIKTILEDLIKGREFLLSVLTSQVISNVPATLLLSEFTQDFKSLLQGVNVGGLGTLIASMASLISYKSSSNAYPDRKVKYIIRFTFVNIIFLAVLILYWYLEKLVFKKNKTDVQVE
ncbi:citrate transporter family protein [Piromyces finnis]|uniref:Citrate transporter family protein n=1 Tax=Piromyces finnis TaxID=1754191 RepID=A0A1Y1UX13_9FUNG|nr:citrate transporter family protein [Piromyces finnis]|eukprot:ORX41757.1 citrate transporter family protein [Piromyces finnis]